MLPSLVQADTIYCVHDEQLNDSQFCYGIALPNPHLELLGPLYQDCDIEALDLDWNTDELYAASGDDTPRPGYLYYVYRHNGNIIDLGDVSRYQALLGSVCQPSSAWRMEVETRIGTEMSSPSLSRRGIRAKALPDITWLSYPKGAWRFAYAPYAR